MEKTEIDCFSNRQLKLLNKKRCSNCNNIFNVSEFSNKQGRCKSCRSEIVLQKYHENVAAVQLEIYYKEESSLTNKQLIFLNKKKCSKCNNILNISQFSNKQGRCKSCRSEIVLQKYHVNKSLFVC